jgi:UDP-3-O-[3-hydroxymyristoyl] glucosamine N-acyltransferase
MSRVARPTSARFFSANPIVDEDLYNRQRSTIELGPRVPSIAGDAFIAPNATVIGDVDIYDGVSILYGAVVRGDLNNIKIGAFSNIQDKAVVHAARYTCHMEPDKAYYVHSFLSLCNFTLQN